MNNCIVKSLFFVLSLFVAAVSFAQTDSLAAHVPSKKKFLNALDLTNRPNDHFMIQYGYDSWGSVPDSINTKGLSRHFNVYVMIDRPLKGSRHASVGVGLGVGSSNIFFKDTYVNLKSPSTTLPFTNVSGNSINRFKKFKLTTIYAEIPLELRYAANPVTPDKGFKAAAGLRVGMLLNQHTKGKNAIDANGTTIYGPTYISKESDKRFINSTRVAATARLGYGNFSIDGSYQITNFLKQGVGPAIHPYSIGLTISGL